MNYTFTKYIKTYFKHISCSYQNEENYFPNIDLNFSGFK